MSPTRFLVLFALLVASTANADADTLFEPGFRIQTGIVEARLADSRFTVIAAAGRDANGIPMLALLRAGETGWDYRELALPERTVAIDSGRIDAQSEALFFLAAGAVWRLDSFSGEPVEHLEIESLYRGRSYAELTSGLNFARNLDDTSPAVLVIPDFDQIHLISESTRKTLDLPSYRRSYDRNVSYRTPTVTLIADAGDLPAAYTIRGDRLLTFPPMQSAASETPLGLGLSDELEQELFYNSYEDIDQNDIVLRELDKFVDINGDELPDIMTLETISKGVFDKTTTYRVHHGRQVDELLVFDAEAHTVLSSRGYQIGARIAPLDEQRQIVVTASVQVGVRAIIGALFSRSVTMRIEIYPPDENGTIAEEPSDTIKSRIKFDFSSGQVEFPTIAFGDIDGDGVSDLILKRRRGMLEWRRGDSGGRFSKDAADLDVMGPTDGTNVTLVDLNGDSRDEIVVLYGRADGAERIGKIAIIEASDNP